ncbi:MAG: ParB/RepB/Spo0J family partition protein [Pseudomonadota bacterium]
MGRKAENKKLGMGLSALLGDVAEAPVKVADKPGKSAAPAGASDRPIQTVAIDLIHPNPDQPRRDFVESDLEELAASIRERGVIQPVILRPDPSRSGQYQIVAGERRWRAAQRAKLHELPVVVRELDDQSVLEIALIENIQRADLNAIEEALGYTQLLERFQYTQETLAKIVGKSRPHLANMLRLLALPAGVQWLVREGKLTAGHARAVVTAPDPEALALRAVREGLTVRQIEDLVRGAGTGKRASKAARRPSKDADTRQIEGDLSAALRMKVTIQHGDAGGGEMRIRYKSLEDLDKLLAHLAN